MCIAVHLSHVCLRGIHNLKNLRPLQDRQHKSLKTCPKSGGSRLGSRFLNPLSCIHKQQALSITLLCLVTSCTCQSLHSDLSRGGSCYLCCGSSRRMLPLKFIRGTDSPHQHAHQRHCFFMDCIPSAAVMSWKQCVFKLHSCRPAHVHLGEGSWSLKALHVDRCTKPAAVRLVTDKACFIP